MLSNSEIMKWSGVYNTQKYPVTVYNDLVVKGFDHNKRMEILGAWKTGCLKFDHNGRAYIDSNGTGYSFTKRWQPNTPVGYNTWVYISQNESKIMKQIPDLLSEKKPLILVELEQKDGFGFIWAIFALHCFYPEIYPLYDQHVYRAYKLLQSNGDINPVSAPNDWNEYLKYRLFFQEQLDVSNYDYWLVDRALWAFGKSRKKVKNSSGPLKLKKQYSTYMQEDNPSLVRSVTLGGKAKSFWWKIDDNCNIIVRREFNSKKARILNSKFIKASEIDRLDKYMGESSWIGLANNVEKLSKGIENEGIGMFMFKELNWSTTDSQLASHIGGILAASRVWLYNGKQRGIKFKKVSNSWRDKVKDYYKFRLLNDIE